MKNKELFIILSQIPNNQHTYYTKNTIYILENNIIVRKIKKTGKGKNNTKQKVTTNETFSTTKTVQYAQKKYV